MGEERMLKSLILCINNKKIEAHIQLGFKKSGYNVLICEDGNSLIRLAHTRHIDLVIVDEELRGLRAIDVVNIIYTEKICPVLIVANDFRNDYIDWIEKGWIYGSVHLPMNQVELLNIVKGAIINGERMLLLDRENEKLRKQLAERKIIEKAKSILIEKKSCTEEDAYTYIRKISMNKGVSMEKIAEAIIKSLDSSR